MENIMGDVNWVLSDFGGRGREEERNGLGVPLLGHLCPKNRDLAKSCHSNRRVLPTRLNHVWRFL